MKKEELQKGKTYTIDVGIGKPINVTILGFKDGFWGRKVFFRQNAEYFAIEKCYPERKFIKSIIN